MVLKPHSLDNSRLRPAVLLNRLSSLNLTKEESASLRPKTEGERLGVCGGD